MSRLLDLLSIPSFRGQESSGLPIDAGTIVTWMHTPMQTNTPVYSHIAQQQQQQQQDHAPSIASRHGYKLHRQSAIHGQFAGLVCGWSKTLSEHI